MFSIHPGSSQESHICASKYPMFVSGFLLAFAKCECNRDINSLLTDDPV